MELFYLSCACVCVWLYRETSWVVGSRRCYFSMVLRTEERRSCETILAFFTSLLQFGFVQMTVDSRYGFMNKMF